VIVTKKEVAKIFNIDLKKKS